MGDAARRKRSAAARLRSRLRKSRESLADHFDFRMYVIFHFKHGEKKRAVFEVQDVIPMMANDYEHSIMKGVANDKISLQSSESLLSKDVVQLHAHLWRSLRNDVIGFESAIDFMLWPRKDINCIECRLFSRWKGEESDKFRPLEMSFKFDIDVLEKHILQLMITKEKNSHILNNAEETVLIFINKHMVKTANRPSSTMLLRLISLCLYIPQDQLTRWASGTMDEIMAPILSDKPMKPNDDFSTL